MDDYPLTLFHDGNCPVCRVDVANLKAHNQDGNLRFIDIAAPDFDAAAYGRTQAELLAEIHAQRPDGSFVKGMEVFRLAYRGVGLGWLLAPADWGALREPANAAYRLFARHRPWISRHFGFVFAGIERCLARRASRRATQCRDGLCTVPPRQTDH